MNKKVLYFASGVGIGMAVGSLVSFFITRKAVWKKCDKEIDEMRGIYLEEAVKRSKEKREISPEIREALEKNWNKPDLHKTYGKSVVETMAENEHPVDSDEDEDIEEALALDHARDLEEEKQKMKGKPPKIISEGEVSELSPGWSTEEWTYYNEDNVMTDTDNQIVESFRDKVGNILDDIGWIDDMEADDIIVMAPDYMTIYRISKVLTAFSDTDYAHVQVYGDLAEAYK